MASRLCGALAAAAAARATAAAGCSPALDPPSLIRNGSDYASVPLSAGSANGTLDHCAALCCAAYPSCVAFSFNFPQPVRSCVGGGGACCDVGGACCMLKSGPGLPLVNNSYGPAVRTGALPLPPGPTPPFAASAAVLSAAFVGDAVAGFWPGSNGDTWPTAQLANGTLLGWDCDAHGSPMSLWRVEGDPYAQNGSSALAPALASATLQPIDYGALCAFLGPTGSFPKINVKPAGMAALPDGTLLAGVSCMDCAWGLASLGSRHPARVARLSLLGLRRAARVVAPSFAPPRPPPPHPHARADGEDAAFNRQVNLAGFLARSDDGGLTWTNATDPTDARAGGRFAAPVLVSCGRAYAAPCAPDGMLYALFFAGYDGRAYWDNNDVAYVGRVPLASAAAGGWGAWTYYAGGAAGGGGAAAAAWSADREQAAPVMEFAGMLGENAVSFNPHLGPAGRFVMANFGLIDNAGAPRPWHTKPYMEPHRTQLLMLEAAAPWGPWAAFYRNDDSGAPGLLAPGLYTPTFPVPYMRARNGTAADAILFFSCLDGDVNCRYTLNWARVRLELAADERPSS